MVDPLLAGRNEFAYELSDVGDGRQKERRQGPASPRVGVGSTSETIQGDHRGPGPSDEGQSI
jgi:hypothetical protein